MFLFEVKKPLSTQNGGFYLNTDLNLFKIWMANIGIRQLL